MRVESFNGHFITKSSDIAGKGNFAARNTPSGLFMGVGLNVIDNTGNPDSDFERSAICTYTNHSDSPNMVVNRVGNKYHFVTCKPIRHGDELTVDYTKFDFEGERDFALKTAKDKPLNRSLDHAWEHYKNTSDKSHSHTHIQSVLSNALHIAKGYPELNKEDVEYAAVLHDIGRETEMLGGTNDHEVIGVHLAKPYISHLSQSRQDKITQAIRNHRNAKGRELSTLDHVIRDADRIPLSSEESVRRIHDYRLSRGSSPEEAARRGYHYLRHNKMTRLDKRTDGIHTPEGKELMGNKIKELEERTRTFKGYISMIKGVDQNLEFKTASESVLYHGSMTQGLKYLVPRSSTHGTYVYAATDDVMPIWNIGRDPYKRDMHMNTGYVNGRPYIKEKTQDALNKAYKGVSGSLYTLNSPGFTSIPGTTSRERVSTTDVKVVSESRVHDVLVKLEEMERMGIIDIHRLDKTANFSDKVAAYNELHALKEDLKGEHEAIALYDRHIATITNKPVVNKLIEIRDEEKHHVKEISELIARVERLKKS